jgi:hypothetical protein
MPFNVGDVVHVLTPDAIRRGQLVRIEQIIPKKLTVHDFKVYIVEFPDAVSEQFRFCLYREFELENISGRATANPTGVEAGRACGFA